MTRFERYLSQIAEIIIGYGDFLRRAHDLNANGVCAWSRIACLGGFSPGCHCILTVAFIRRGVRESANYVERC